MVEPADKGEPQAGYSTHPALKAWNRLSTPLPALQELSVIRDEGKSCIYRLRGTGANSFSVVAKQSRTAARERIVYEQVLPKLRVSYPRYFGFVEGEEGRNWLFLEYAEGEHFSLSCPKHRAWAGEWLAALHGSAERAELSGLLPFLGPDQYLQRMQQVRARLQEALTSCNWPADDQGVVATVIAQCDFLESRWDCVERWCAELPQTLVHGDFKPKNVIIQFSLGAPNVLVFDWETSGWGPPTEDLAYVDPSAYFSAVRDFWPGIGARRMDHMAILGRIFRGLSEYVWESRKFEPHWQVSAAKLGSFYARTAHAISLAEWSN